MPTLVQFGAGNIGRGFIADLFSAADWAVCMVDVDESRITALQERGGYRIRTVTADAEQERQVGPVSALLAGDHTAVATAVAEADLLATAVGLGALPHLGANIAAGLTRRWQAGGGPIDILVCENGVQAPAILGEAITAELPPELQARFAVDCGLVRSSIGRMIPSEQGADPLDMRVEPYAKLPLDGAAFRADPPSAVPGVQLVEPFDLVLQQKLYLHNGTHAALAYGGHLRGHQTLVDCMADRDLVQAVRAAGLEICAALATEHGHDAAARAAIHAGCVAMLGDLLERYANPALGDTVARVARDPWRKCAVDDRLIGALLLCRRHELPCNQLARLVWDALRYTPAADEPRAQEWLTAQAQDWRSLLGLITGLPPDHDLYAVLMVAERQAAAAARIRASGIVISAREEADIEIADFGLGRYQELGLAIHVYINTERCCAKELAMEPGQMCPEHKHPSVDGEPGKEETFRVRAGECHLFVPESPHHPGDPQTAQALLPAGKEDSVSVHRHLHLRTGDQYTLVPDTLHWFVAGPAGAVISEFSSRSRDDDDIFTDAAIQRVPELGPHVG